MEKTGKCKGGCSEEPKKLIARGLCQTCYAKDLKARPAGTAKKRRKRRAKKAPRKKPGRRPQGKAQGTFTEIGRKIDRLVADTEAKRAEIAKLEERIKTIRLELIKQRAELLKEGREMVEDRVQSLDRALAQDRKSQ